MNSKLKIPETVNSLHDAIELALGIYIEDFKVKEVAKPDSNSILDPNIHCFCFI